MCRPYGEVVLPQPGLDHGIRAALRADPRVTHALTYGSFPQGQADAFSDLEYYAYLAPGAEFDVRAFLESLTPLMLYTVNDLGTPNAVTPELIRVELHAVPDTQMSELLTWPNAGVVPEQMLIKDSSGRLRSLLAQLASGPVWAPDPPQFVYDRLLHWLTFGSAVLVRGERTRALHLLVWVHGGLLRLARFQVGSAHPPAVQRHAERDLPAEILGRFARCTGGLADLERAYSESLAWAAELAAGLRLDRHAALLAALTARLNAL